MSVVTGKTILAPVCLTMPLLVIELSTHLFQMEFWESLCWNLALENTVSEDPD